MCNRLASSGNGNSTVCMYITLYLLKKRAIATYQVVTPRYACAARVTVLGLCVCLCVTHISQTQ